jgi:hypothetical protein
MNNQYESIKTDVRNRFNTVVRAKRVNAESLPIVYNTELVSRSTKSILVKSQQELDEFTTEFEQFLSPGNLAFLLDEANNKILTFVWIDQNIKWKEVENDGLESLGLFDTDNDGKIDFANLAINATSADHATTANSALTAEHSLESDHASIADSATNSDNATNADNALTANHATTADNATNANHATTADSASSASHASTADSASTAGSVNWGNIAGTPLQFQPITHQHLASEVMINDADGNFVSTEKTVENIVKELFQSGVNVKSDVVTAVNAKTTIPVTTNSSWSEVINSISLISNGNSNSLKNTKLNLTAPTSYSITLSGPITLQQLATSVLKYIPGATGVVQYLSNFNNSDSVNFTAGTTVAFDGTMHLIDKSVSGPMTSYSLSSGTCYETSTIDFDQFYYVSNVIINDVASPTFIANGTNNPTIVKANGDINLSNVQEIAQIVWTTNVSGQGVLKLITSVDSGVSWKAFNGTDWITVDINNISDFKTNGNSVATINSLTISQLELLRQGSSKIRFAYYIEKENVSDIANNDAITLKVNMKGNDSIAAQTDFSYSLGSDMKTITYAINTSGTYTFVYADSVVI